MAITKDLPYMSNIFKPQLSFQLHDFAFDFVV